jgi:hypothetical protein
MECHDMITRIFSTFPSNLGMYEGNLVGIKRPVGIMQHWVIG